MTKLERAEFNLSDQTRQVLVGILLGDAHIQIRSNSSINARLKYTQSIVHKEYFDHIYELFKHYTTESFLPYYLSQPHTITQKNSNSWTFVTMSLPCFKLYRDLFYNSDGVKIVPENIGDLLTPIGLAYWVMDDGSKLKKGLHLNTYGFNSQDIDLLLNVLRNKFNLKCSTHIKNGRYRIYIGYESMDLLRSLVSPHMHSSMMYKIED